MCESPEENKRIRLMEEEFRRDRWTTGTDASRLPMECTVQRT